MKTTTWSHERRLAVGARLTSKRIIGIRAASAATHSRPALSPSGGVSAAFRPGMYIDAELTVELRKAARLGVAARVTF